MSAFDDWYKQMFCEKPLIAALQTEPYDFPSYSRDDLEQAFNAGRKLGNNDGKERAAERNDYFAKMMESGAGEAEPGERLRQVAREIRKEISND